MPGVGKQGAAARADSDQPATALDDACSIFLPMHLRRVISFQLRGDGTGPLRDRCFPWHRLTDPSTFFQRHKAAGE